MNKCKVIVIDTNQYAGNFERKLCAYLTGQVGDCRVGAEYTDLEEDEGPVKHLEWWNEHIAQMPDSGELNPIERPVEIFSNPRYVNNGYGGQFLREGYTGKTKCDSYQSVAIFVDEFPPVEVFNELNERMIAAVADPSIFGYKGTDYIDGVVTPMAFEGFRFFNRKDTARYCGGGEFTIDAEWDEVSNPYI